jgi:hypothetical protein
MTVFIGIARSKKKCIIFTPHLFLHGAAGRSFDGGVFAGLYFRL